MTSLSSDPYCYCCASYVANRLLTKQTKTVQVMSEYDVNKTCRFCKESVFSKGRFTNVRSIFGRLTASVSVNAHVNAVGGAMFAAVWTALLVTSSS